MSGGGTAGHVYPALSVAELLVAEGDEVIFVGTPDGPEADLIPEAGLAFRALGARGFDRARPWTLVTSSGRIAASAIVAAGWLRREQPAAVLGFGGYASIPVGIAAALMRVPVVLHEQNSVPGLANRVLSRFARAVGVTYESSRRYFHHPERVEVTGNPVRRAVLEASRELGRRTFGIPDDAIVLLVFGGSRGARHINEAALGLRESLLVRDRLVVLHVTGRSEYATVTHRLAQGSGDEGGRWRVFDYLHEMGPALAAADVVVARAGATSIAEITATGVASVLVPYPYATDDHQTLNAAALEAAGAAVVVHDEELDTPLFGDALMTLLDDPVARATMAAASRSLGRRDAAQRVVGLVRAVVSGRDRNR